jgi:hypothetical protein
LNKEDLTKTKVANFSVAPVSREWVDGAYVYTPLALTAATDIYDIYFSFKFDELEGSKYYVIYAKESKGDNVFTGIVGFSDSYAEEGKVVYNLSSSLGSLSYYYLDLSSDTPFAGGGAIEFIVQAYESNGSSNKTPFNTADVKTVKAP